MLLHLCSSSVLTTWCLFYVRSNVLRERSKNVHVCAGSIYIYALASCESFSSRCMVSLLLCIPSVLLRTTRNWGGYVTV